MRECLYCKSETKNPKFCSKSCAARHNNSLYPKRKRTKKCSLCNNTVLSYVNKCKNCLDKESIMNKPLSYFDTGYYSGSNKYGSIRFWARKVAREIKDECKNCGYNKHVEVCHLKPISEFPKETIVREINSIGNLVKLCPNCHWEYDNGLISFGGKGKN